MTNYICFSCGAEA